MIELYSTNVAATTGMVLPWNNKAVQVGACATLNSDSQTIALNRAGVYEVTVNAYGTTTAAGDFGLQLNGSGVAITRGAAVETTADAGATASIAFSALVNVSAAVAPAKAALTVTYTGNTGTISLANIVVKKVR